MIMQTFVIPGWVGINLVLLVAAAIFVAVKLAAEDRTGRRRPASKPVSPGIGRAIK
jgi:hypothetical protein